MKPTLAWLCVGLVPLPAAALQFPVPASGAETRITFSQPPVPAPGFNFRLPEGTYVPEHHKDPDHTGTFAGFTAGKVASVEVQWADTFRFRSEAQTATFIRDLLHSAHTEMYSFHVWSWGDGQPSVMATVTHANGTRGRWIIWVQPIPYWAYQDDGGEWWWGAWDSGFSRRPMSANVPGILPLPVTTVSGHVIDDATGKPFAGVTVEISAGGVPCSPGDKIAAGAPIPDCVRALEEGQFIKKVVTGDDGAFRFEKVPIGQFMVHAEKAWLKIGEFIPGNIGPRDSPKPVVIDLHLSSATSTRPHI